MSLGDNGELLTHIHSPKMLNYKAMQAIIILKGVFAAISATIAAET
ncbi:hypothetical protein PPIS_a1297 [Pseudoalteromonas piscicida]|uniref:Uncharacterized protein n=1 Tax=Pseudoalteromonas piscicida TaxID=43662 RepID=A0ABM6NCL1_PSEO7|nr:hypothetical protein PPIS_a1297 [Pseudoalteromonas piscicida]